MPRKGHSHIQFLLDRSGSMDSIRTDMEGGFNTLIADQKKEPGTCTVGLDQFDDIFETVYENTPLKEVPNLILQPRNSTALIDAACRSIDALGVKLAAMPEADRPEHVIYVIITDGLENASREFNRKQLKERIERQTKQYDWKFIYLGANQDAIAEAGQYGIQRGTTMTYDADSDSVPIAYAAASNSVSSYRGGNSAGAVFTKAQREAASKSGKEKK